MVVTWWIVAFLPSPTKYFGTCVRGVITLCITVDRGKCMERLVMTTIIYS